MLNITLEGYAIIKIEKYQGQYSYGVEVREAVCHISSVAPGGALAPSRVREGRN